MKIDFRRLIQFVSLGLTGFVVTVALLNIGQAVFFTNVNKTSAFFGDVPTSINQNGVTVNVDGISENLSPNGVYAVTYRYTSPNHQDVSFTVEAETDRCDEPNGYTNTPRGGCPENTVLTYPTITLNAANNWTQDLSLSVTQAGYKPCGSFQTDLRHNHTNHYAYATSIYHTGKDLNNPSSCTMATPTPTPSYTPSPTPTPTPSPSCPPVQYGLNYTGWTWTDACPTPTPTPTPSVTPTPTPTPKPSHTPHPTPTPTPQPTPTPSTVQCPINWVHQVFGSTIVCVAQNQEQSQAQIQNNNQNQDVNQNVTATGGSSSSSSSSSSNANVTINN